MPHLNTASSRRRLFIQYMNPEILSLYGWDLRSAYEAFYRHVLRLTVYGLLFSNDSVIIPESYLHEVKFIDRFLSAVDPLVAAGILQYAGPTADPHLYALKKKQEYRDELFLFRGYEEADKQSQYERTGMVWFPRIHRSSSADISDAWRGELYKPDGIWRQIIERRKPQLTLLPSVLETEIESIPTRLEARAFIHRYVKPLLPLTLELGEQTQLGMLISRAYLQSYLEELDATILIDTPIGGLDCGLPRVIKGSLRTFSFHRFQSFFRSVNLSEYIEHRLRWLDLIRLRDNLVFQWLVNLLILDEVDANQPFANAILHSRCLVNELPYVGRKPLEAVLDRLNRLFDSVEPILRTYSTGGQAIMDITRPEKEKSVIRRRRLRDKRSAGLIKDIEPDISKLYKEICDFLTELAIFHAEDSRRSVAYFAGLDSRLLAQIDFGGNTNVFIRSIIKLLMDYGKLTNGEESLAVFLVAVKHDVGEGSKGSIDKFINQWTSLLRVDS